jgi:hypothetical protein
MKQVIAIIKHQLRIIRRDPWFLLIMFLMPLVVMPLFKRTMGLSLQASGFEGATGAEQVVPGQAVMFGFFVGGSAGFCLFREHGWRTWDRLRASSVSPGSLLLGFMIPWVVMLALFQCALLAVGGPDHAGQLNASHRESGQRVSKCWSHGIRRLGGCPGSTCAAARLGACGWSGNPRILGSERSSRGVS